MEPIGQVPFDEPGEMKSGSVQVVHAGVETTDLRVVRSINESGTARSSRLEQDDHSAEATEASLEVSYARKLDVWHEGTWSDPLNRGAATASQARSSPPSFNPVMTPAHAPVTTVQQPNAVRPTNQGRSRSPHHAHLVPRRIWRSPQRCLKAPQRWWATGCPAVPTTPRQLRTREEPTDRDTRQPDHVCPRNLVRSRLCQDAARICDHSESAGLEVALLVELIPGVHHRNELNQPPPPSRRPIGLPTLGKVAWSQNFEGRCVGKQAPPG